MGVNVTYVFEGIALSASIGILAEEKAAPQRILIDLEYDCVPSQDPRDEIGAVLDYDRVRQEVAAIAQRGHFNLQETLCREILASLLAHPQVARAKVFLRKPDIYEDVEAVGVRMEEQKALKPTA